MDIDKTIKGLISLAKQLNKHNIRWALGASLMLYLEGYDVTVQDIDIVVHEDDYKALIEMLKDYDYTYQEPNEQYMTEHFFSLTSEGIEVDIMVNFKILKEDHIYHFPFHIEKEMSIKNTKIYLSSIEEWLNAYKAMNRVDKVLLIQSNKKRN